MVRFRKVPALLLNSAIMNYFVSEGVWIISAFGQGLEKFLVHLTDLLFLSMLCKWEWFKFFKMYVQAFVHENSLQYSWEHWNWITAKCCWEQYCHLFRQVVVEMMLQSVIYFFNLKQLLFASIGISQVGYMLLLQYPLASCASFIFSGVEQKCYLLLKCLKKSSPSRKMKYLEVDS